MMIYITALRQAFERYEITDIGWIPSDQNVADGFTNPTKCASLEKFLDTGTLDLEVA